MRFPVSHWRLLHFVIFLSLFQTCAAKSQGPVSPSAAPFQPSQVGKDLPGDPTKDSVKDHTPPATRQEPVSSPDPDRQVVDELGSTYLPVDSPVYPMALRLYSLGYLNTAFVNMRPWTRRSLQHMLNASSDAIMADGSDEAMSLFASLQSYISEEDPGADRDRGQVYGLASVYTRFMGIGGTPLRDSYHLGETIANDYGRPYAAGFNNITGFSSVNETGRFSLFVRGEYQHAPSAVGYSQALSQQLSQIDKIPYSGYNLDQSTIPTGPTVGTNAFALQEATLSVHLLGHEISGGKSDAWLSPAQGAAMGWSNNAQNIYSFRVNRVEPLRVPLLSRITGPITYDFFVGSLKGHTYPNSPWVHSDTVALAPTSNIRLSFQRVVIWGGEGHAPVTLHTFLRSFFDFSDTSPAIKLSSADPGARFSSFNFSWRLPYVENRLTLYTDSTVHDDVTPISAPRRAAYRPGLYLAQLPRLPKFDFRIEGTNTDFSTKATYGGQDMYIEVVQKQGYTNKGQLFGDWVGREGKGGQAWLTYHHTANEWIQLEYMHKKTARSFIPGGTTQNQFMLQVVKRIQRNVELNASYQFEGWKAPIYFPGKSLNKDNTVSFQVTWFPVLHTK